jgi:hypothetical protein
MKGEALPITALLLSLVSAYVCTDVASFSLVSIPSLKERPLVLRPTSSSLFATVDDTPRTSDPPEKVTQIPRRGFKKRQVLAIHKLPKAAYRIYVSYVRQLWRETDPAARKVVANEKIQGAIRNMQHILSCNEYTVLSDDGKKSLNELMKACDKMLTTMSSETPVASAVPKVDLATSSIPGGDAAKKKPRRSIMLGVLMGIATACWVFSGNYVFTALFTLMTILGQLEYYRMIMRTGVYPARRISVIGASSMFLTVS